MTITPATPKDSGALSKVSKRTESSGVAPLRREGILHSDTATKANILNDKFTSVFSSDQGGDIHVPTKGTALMHLYQA